MLISWARIDDAARSWGFAPSLTLAFDVKKSAAAPVASTIAKRGRRTIDASTIGPDELAKIALQLFAERHYASVTIKDIGRAAGINSAMIYYYYKDKDHLFSAAIGSAIDEAFELFEEHCNPELHKSPVEAINSWFDVHVELRKTLRSVVKISLDCNGFDGVPDAIAPIRGFYSHESEILQKFIRQGIKQKIFKKVDSVLVATMISTFLDGAMARTFIFDDFALSKAVDQFKKTLWAYLGA